MMTQQATRHRHPNRLPARRASLLHILTLLTLAPSGWTYDFIFLLVDRETGSLWYPDEKGLKAVQGPLFGRRLPTLPSTDTRWSEWRRDHPESHVLP